MLGEMRLRRLVKRITYKPYSVLKLARKDKHMVLSVHLWTVDSNNPDKMRWVEGYYPFYPEYVARVDDRALTAEIMTCIAYLELHDVYEWFKVDGKFFKHPHPVEPLLGEYPREIAMDFRQRVHAK